MFLLEFSNIWPLLTLFLVGGGRGKYTKASPFDFPLITQKR